MDASLIRETHMSQNHWIDKTREAKLGAQEPGPLWSVCLVTWWHEMIHRLINNIFFIKFVITSYSYINVKYKLVKWNISDIFLFFYLYSYFYSLFLFMFKFVYLIVIDYCLWYINIFVYPIYWWKNCMVTPYFTYYQGNRR